MNWDKIKKAIRQTIKEDIQSRFKKKKKKKEKLAITENAFIGIVNLGGTIVLLAVGLGSFIWTILYGLGIVPSISFESTKLIVGGVFILPLGVVWHWFWNRVELRLRPKESKPKIEEVLHSEEG